MPKGNAWTTGEIAYLRRYAGRKTVAEIARHLGRSRSVVESRMKRLHLATRVYEWKLVECPECHEWRTKVTGGLCPVCSRKQTRARQEERISQLEQALPADAVSRMRPATQGSRTDPAPNIQTDSDDPFEQARVAERRAIARERWEVAQMDRANNARRRRINRLEAMLGDMEKLRPFTDQ